MFVVFNNFSQLTFLLLNKKNYFILRKQYKIFPKHYKLDIMFPSNNCPSHFSLHYFPAHGCCFFRLFLGPPHKITNDNKIKKKKSNLSFYVGFYGRLTFVFLFLTSIIHSVHIFNREYYK